MGSSAHISELEAALRELGETALADVVPSLEVHGRCQCGESDCGTFYTLPRSVWLGVKLRQVIPELAGLMAIDVHEDRMVCVEFLDRPDVAALLDEHFGRPSPSSHPD